MKKHLNFRLLMAMILVISMTIPFIGCDKEPVDERPELPPVESLLMDFSNFQHEPGGTKGTMVTYVNFSHSYGSVTFWNIASTLTMALPVAAYGHALEQEAVYVGDHTWEWSFDFAYEGINYTATLTGARLSNEEFSMEMVIALTALPEQGIKWFDGKVRYDHTHATWNFYKQGNLKVLFAEWHKNYETEAGDLTYTYVEPSMEETGSFIMFKYMPQEVYDAVYTIALASGITEIEWNLTTLEGRVKDLVKFGNTDWHCWDSKANGLADKICD